MMLNERIITMRSYVNNSNAGQCKWFPRVKAADPCSKLNENRSIYKYIYGDS